MEPLTGILGTLRALTPRVLLGLAIGTGALLFSGDWLLKPLGLSESIANNRETVGVVFALSLSLVLAHGIASVWEIVVDEFRKWKAAREKARSKELSKATTRDYLRKLTRDEKHFLKPYILNDENTRNAEFNDGVAGGLISAGIIYIASQYNDLYSGINYNLQPWVREFLKENTEFLIDD